MSWNKGVGPIPSRSETLTLVDAATVYSSEITWAAQGRTIRFYVNLDAVNFASTTFVVSLEASFDGVTWTEIDSSLIANITAAATVTATYNPYLTASAGCWPKYRLVFNPDADEVGNTLKYAVVEEESYNAVPAT